MGQNLPGVSDLKSAPEFRQADLKQQLYYFDEWANRVRESAQQSVNEGGREQVENWLKGERNKIELEAEFTNPDGNIWDTLYSGLMSFGSGVKTAGALKESVKADLYQKYRGIYSDEFLDKKTAQSREKQVELLMDAERDSAIAESVPLDAGMREFMEAEGFKDSSAALFNNFGSVVAHTIAGSLPHMAGAVVGGSVGSILGPGGGVVGAFAGGSGAEFTASYRQALEEMGKDAGIDTSTPEGLAEAMGDEVLNRGAIKRAAIRAGVIGSVDAIAQGIVGKVISKFGSETAKGVERVARNTAAAGTQAVLEAPMESAGELAAQVAIGQEVDWKDITLEGIGGFGQGAARAGGVMTTQSLQETIRKVTGDQPVTPTDDVQAASGDGAPADSNNPFSFPGDQTQPERPQARDFRQGDLEVSADAIQAAVDDPIIIDQLEDPAAQMALEAEANRLRAAQQAFDQGQESAAPESLGSRRMDSGQTQPAQQPLPDTFQDFNSRAEAQSLPGIANDKQLSTLRNIAGESEQEFTPQSARALLNRGYIVDTGNRGRSKYQLTDQGKRVLSGEGESLIGADLDVTNPLQMSASVDALGNSMRMEGSHSEATAEFAGNMLAAAAKLGGDQAPIKIQQFADLASAGINPDANVLPQYAGENANVPDDMRRNLGTAKAMAAAGKDSEEIRALTGWFPGQYDGKMRFEVSDLEAVTWFKNEDGSKRYPIDDLYESKGVAQLGTILDHPKLYEVYPDAQYIKVRYVPSKMLAGYAAFVPFRNEIWLNDNNNPANSTPKRDLMHEIQHWIQEREGFATGASNRDVSRQNANKALELEERANQFEEYANRAKDPRVEKVYRDHVAALRNYVNWLSTQDAIDDGYLNSAGEIEARDTEARMLLNDEERAELAPYSTDNIAPEDAYVMFGSGNIRDSAPREDRNARHAELEAKHNAGTITPEETAEAERLVEEAAKAAGYNTSVWHGTQNDFNVFDATINPDQPGIHLASTESQAFRAAGARRKSGMPIRRIIKGYARLNNPLRITDGNNNSGQYLWGQLEKEHNLTPGELRESRMFDDTSVFNSLRSAMDNRGYDGFVYKNKYEGDGDSYIALSPNQIKSADPFTGVPLSERFDESQDSILFQENTGGFYSGVLRVLEDKMPGKASPAQVMGILNPQKSPVKKAEIEWLGIEQWLEGKQSVTKDEVLDFVRQNGVEIEETNLDDFFDEIQQELEDKAEELREEYREEVSIVLVDEDDLYVAEVDSDDHGYAQGVDYERYRVDLLGGSKETFDSFDDAQTRYDDEMDWIDTEAFQVVDLSIEDANGNVIESFEFKNSVKYRDQRRNAGRATNYREVLLKIPNEDGGYTSGHFEDHENIAVWARIDDRKDAEGNKVLFINEIQSDWAGDLNKSGARNEAEIARLEKERIEKISEMKLMDELYSVHDDTPIQEDEYQYFVTMPDGVRLDVGKGVVSRDEARGYLTRLADSGRKEGKFKDVNKVRNEFSDINTKLRGAKSAAPSMPFAKTYHELALKKLLMMATEEGYDKLAWTTGAQQIDLYSSQLRQNVDRMEWKKLNDGTIHVDIPTRSGTVLQFVEQDPGGKVTGSESADSIEEVVGKTIADQIRNSDESSGIIEGDDLSIGGHFHKLMYGNADDKPGMIGSFLKKFTKKWGGGQIERAQVNGETQHAIAITPQIRESIPKEGMPLFARNQSNSDIKGFFDASRRLIGILPTADGSTILHEIGHSVKYLLGDSDAGKTLASYYGVKNGQWTTAQEERFARHVERYFRDGKVPDAATGEQGTRLKQAFEQLADMMRRLYARLRGSVIEEQVPPDVRKFLDDLLILGDDLRQQAQSNPAQQTFRSSFSAADTNQKNPHRIQIAPLEGEVKPHSKVIFNVARALGSTIKYKGNAPNSYGSYNTGTTSTRVQYEGDLDTVAHELGHIVDDKFGFGDYVFRQGVQRDVDQELLKPEFLSTTTPDDESGVIRAEMLAEFVRGMIINPTETRALAPFTASMFDAVMPTKAKTALDEFGKQIRAWEAAPASEKILANTKLDPTGRLRKMIDAFRGRKKANQDGFIVGAWDRVAAKWLDDKHPFIKAANFAEESQGQQVLPKDDPRILVRLLAGHADKELEVIEKGMIDARGNTVLPGGVDWLFEPFGRKKGAELDRDFRDVVALMIAERTMELSDRTKRPYRDALQQLNDLNTQINANKNAQKGLINDLIQEYEGSDRQDIAENLKRKTQSGVATAVKSIIAKEASKFNTTPNTNALNLARQLKAMLDLEDSATSLKRKLPSLRKKMRDDLLTGIGAGFKTDIEVASQALAELQADPARYAMLQEAAGRYRQWGKANLQYMLDKGRITQEACDNITNANQYYVALNRILETAPNEEIDQVDFGNGGNLGSVAETIHKIRGSTKQIKNPYMVLLESSGRMIKEADRNEVLAKFADLLEVQRRLYEGDTHQLASIGTRVDEDPNPKNRPKNTQVIYRNGEPEIWQFDDDIHKALKGLSGLSSMPGWMQVPAKLLKWGITNMPAFAIRNLMRDTQARFLVSRSSLAESIRATAPTEIRKTLRNFKIYGGSQGGFYTRDETNYYRILQNSMGKLATDKNGVVVTGRAIRDFFSEIGPYRRLLEKGEQANRMAEYKAAFNEGKKLGYDDLDAHIYAAAQARDLMDFAVAGELGRKWNQIVPFFNAAIQGTRRTFRAAGENPSVFAIRFFLFALAPVIMHRLMIAGGEDEDEYEQLPAYLRDMYWNIKVAPDLWLRIPKNFESGVLASGADRLISQIRGYEDPWKGYGGSAYRAVIPVDDQTLMGPLKPWYEAMANKDLFRDKSIVSPFQANVDLDATKADGTRIRTREQASRIGQAFQEIAETIGLSDTDLGRKYLDARVVDHLFKGVLGTFGETLLRASNIGRDDTNKKLGLKDVGLFVNSPAYAAKDVQEVYKLAERVNLRQNKMLDNLDALMSAYFSAETAAARDKAATEMRKEAQRLLPILRKEVRQRKARQSAVTAAPL